MKLPTRGQCFTVVVESRLGIKKDVELTVIAIDHEEAVWSCVGDDGDIYLLTFDENGNSGMLELSVENGRAD